MNTTAKSIWSETIPFSKIPGMERVKINGPLRPVTNDTLVALLGHPRGTYTQECLRPQNPRFIALIETADLGPFRATGLRPAIAALKAVMADIQTEQPDVHHRLGTAGMLCCRFVRGSHAVVSDHAWGTAIDLTIDGKLDLRGDERAQRGLLDIAPIFQRHGFYWGAAFRTEDAMHFQASDQLVREWAQKGLLGGVAKPPKGHLMVGSRGPAVLDLQQALNRALGLAIAVDGLFGPMTRSAVLAYQAGQGMKQTGNAGPTLLHRLGLS